jgi:hypothetical protein
MNEAKLIAEVTVLTEMVRVLSDRIAQMESEKTLQALHDENDRLGLYKQEQGEPVAWMNSKRDMTYTHGPYNADDIPLYTAPQQRTWVELTDKEAQWLYDNCRTPANLIDMVEAKLKDKNDPNGT